MAANPTPSASMSVSTMSVASLRTSSSMRLIVLHFRRRTGSGYMRIFRIDMMLGVTRAIKEILQVSVLRAQLEEGSIAVFCLGMGVTAGTVSHMGGRVDFTLTFDSSPIKGEGDSVGVVFLLPVPCLSPLDCGSSPQ